MIPIWFANEHRNPTIISNTIKNLDNIKKRNDCYIKIEEEYLAIFKFALCPVGNSVDTYFLWECFYFKVIPIVIDKRKI
jgi:hypothetical protein